MKLLLALPVAVFTFLLPLITGVAVRATPNKFWLWFYAGIPLLFIVSVILFCAVEKPGTKKEYKRPVENDELFDHLFVNKNKKTKLFRRLAS